MSSKVFFIVIFFGASCAFKVCGRSFDTVSGVAAHLVLICECEAAARPPMSAGENVPVQEFTQLFDSVSLLRMSALGGVGFCQRFVYEEEAMLTLREEVRLLVLT